MNTLKYWMRFMKKYEKEFNPKCPQYYFAEFGGKKRWRVRILVTEA